MHGSRAPVSTFRGRCGRMSSLITRNLRLGGRRTSVRLEGAMWDALVEIADREASTVNQICTWVDGHRAETGFTSSLRVYILNYFRFAAAPGNATDFGRHGGSQPPL